MLCAVCGGLIVPRSPSRLASTPPRLRSHTTFTRSSTRTSQIGRDAHSACSSGSRPSQIPNPFLSLNPNDLARFRVVTWLMRRSNCTTPQPGAPSAPASILSNSDAASAAPAGDGISLPKGATEQSSNLAATPVECSLSSSGGRAGGLSRVLEVRRRKGGGRGGQKAQKRD